MRSSLLNGAIGRFACASCRSLLQLTGGVGLYPLPFTLSRLGSLSTPASLDPPSNR